MNDIVGQLNELILRRQILMNPDDPLLVGVRNAVEEIEALRKQRRALELKLERVRNLTTDILEHANERYLDSAAAYLLAAEIKDLTE